MSGRSRFSWGCVLMELLNTSSSTPWRMRFPSTRTSISVWLASSRARRGGRASSRIWLRSTSRVARDVFWSSASDSICTPRVVTALPDRSSFTRRQSLRPSSGQRSPTPVSLMRLLPSCRSVTVVFSARASAMTSMHRSSRWRPVNSTTRSLSSLARRRGTIGLMGRWVLRTIALSRACRQSAETRGLPITEQEVTVSFQARASVTARTSPSVRLLSSSDRRRRVSVASSIVFSAFPTASPPSMLLLLRLRDVMVRSSWSRAVRHFSPRSVR
mmetsp:Transcript_50383/g.90067  ORF Transcript_50383/g.90067 Transcript_50383/m.90067 type:complete len:272 (+) Transcript_50383:2110-2925(+)